MGARVLRRAAGLRTETFQSEAFEVVVWDGASQSVHRLVGAAAAVWTALDGASDRSSIATEMASVFGGCADDFLSGVDDAVRQFDSARLLVDSNPPDVTAVTIADPLAVVLRAGHDRIGVQCERPAFVRRLDRAFACATGVIGDEFPYQLSGGTGRRPLMTVTHHGAMVWRGREWKRMNSALRAELVGFSPPTGWLRIVAQPVVEHGRCALLVGTALAGRASAHRVRTCWVSAETGRCRFPGHIDSRPLDAIVSLGEPSTTLLSASTGVVGAAVDAWMDLLRRQVVVVARVVDHAEALSRARQFVTGNRGSVRD